MSKTACDTIDRAQSFAKGGHFHSTELFGFSTVQGTPCFSQSRMTRQVKRAAAMPCCACAERSGVATDHMVHGVPR
eukprot:2012744-Heterocapsa_arctica.AAC.1